MARVGRQRHRKNMLTAIGLTPGGSSTVHIHTQTIHRTKQWKKNIQIRTNIIIKLHNKLVSINLRHLH